MQERIAKIGVLFTICFLFFEVSSAQDCGDTIIESVTLTADLVCEGGGLIIGADDITLDGNGHSIWGPGPNVPQPSGAINGVFLGVGISAVTVKNLQVRDFPTGIRLYRSSLNTIVNNDLSNNHIGIRVESVGANGNTISGNIFSGSQPYSILITTDADDNDISGNTVRNSAGGIALQRNSGNVLSGNRLSDCWEGISLWESQGAIISGNRVLNQLGTGPAFALRSGSTGNVLQGNHATENQGEGFSADSTSINNTFVKNSSKDNWGFGFVDSSAGSDGTLGTGNTYSRNKCHNDESNPPGLCRLIGLSADLDP